MANWLTVTILGIVPAQFPGAPLLRRLEECLWLANIALFAAFAFILAPRVVGEDDVI